MKVPLSPHPLQYLLFLVFLIIAILTGIKSHLQIGACHLPQQESNYEPLQLLTFNTPERSSVWRSGMTHSVLWEKLVKQEIDTFRRQFYEPNSCISKYLEKQSNPSWWHLLLVIFTRLAEIFCKIIWGWLHVPKSRIYWPFPATSLEPFLKAEMLSPGL